MSDAFRYPDPTGPLYIGPPPYTEVSAVSHPRVFEAFELISLDADYGRGRPHYAVPATWTDRLAQAEHALAHLPDAQAIEAFAVGDEADHHALIARHPNLADTHDLLNEFFDGYAITFEPQDADA